MRYVGALAVVGSLAAGVWVVSQPPPPATTGELQFPKLSAPYTCSAGREGRVYYDMDVDTPYWCDDTNWVSFTGLAIAGTFPFIPRFDSTGLNIEDSVLRATGLPAAGAGGNLLDVSKTINAMDGSDTIRGFHVNLNNASHTGSGNIFRGISIAGITSVSTAQEIALYIGDGWEEAIVTDGFVVSGPPGAASSGRVARVGWTLAAMDGSDTVRALQINPTNADHTGSSNEFLGISLASITGDAEATETAVEIQAGWDNAFDTPLLDVMGKVPAAGTGGNIALIIGTLNAMDDGSDGIDGLEIDLNNANHTAGFLRGIQITSITGDADASEVALQIGGGWDTAISTGVGFSVNGSVPVAATNYNMVNMGADLAVMDGNDFYRVINSTNLTNVDHTGSNNTITYLYITNITADAQAEGTAIHIGSGWDNDINSVDEFHIDLDGSPVNASGELAEFGGTVSQLNGSDVVDFLKLSPTASGSHTGTGNYVNGLTAGTISGDVDAAFSALNINAGWDAFLTAEVKTAAWASTSNPPANKVSLFMDESGANCNLTARLSDGTEIVVAILVVAGNCP